MSPCKNCGERSIGCHGDCEKYVEFRQSIEAATERRKRENVHKNYMNGLKHVTRVTGGKSR